MQFRRCAARLLPLAFALMSSAALAAPAVTVSPGGDHPKGSTKVSGAGFGANEEVDLYFDTADEALVTADASGNFGPHTIPVPATALPGSHWVTAIGRSTITGGQHAFNVRTNWPSIGFDDLGQRHNPYENVIDATNVGNLDLAWTAKVGGRIDSPSPAVAQVTTAYNPYIFVGSSDKYLYAFDSTGALAWKQALSDGVGSPTVSGTTVYVSSGDYNLYALNARNGAPVWPSPATTAGIMNGAPTVANGIVYVGAWDGKVYAFHASDGTPAWPSPAVTGGAILGCTPAVANGVVYIGSSDHKLYALDANTGATVWSFTATDRFILASPAVADGVVYFASTSSGSEDSSKLHAVNARTGKQKWAVTYPYEFANSGPAVANGIVYQTAGELYAYRASDGTKLWTGWYGNGASPVVANGVVYIEGGEGVVAYNANGCGAATCLPLWSTANDSGSPPVIANGFVYMGSENGSLYAYALNGGDTPAYQFRNKTHAPSFASLHPDMRLKPSRH